MAFAYDASLGYNNVFIGRCIMRKPYKKRSDIIEMTGQVFNDLTVVSYAQNGKYRGAYWLCRCICGNECIVPGGHLRANMRKSCGCRSELRIDEVGVNRLFSGYKRKSILKNREFSLTRAQFETLVKGNCEYCGNRPSQILKRLKSRKLQTIYNGIDRKDPSIGYKIENCVSACRYCNQAKSDLTVEQFMAHTERIYKWHLTGS